MIIRTILAVLLVLPYDLLVVRPIDDTCTTKNILLFFS